MRSFILMILLLPTLVAAADDDSFLLGYTTALLEHGLTDAAVEIEAATTHDGIILRSSECLDDEQRRRAEVRLLHNPRIQQVRWQMPCLTTVALRESADAPASHSTVIGLPTHHLFRPLLADPREMSFSARYQKQTLGGIRRSATAASLAGSFGLVSGRADSVDWQLGVQGGVFALFDFTDGNHDLLNADYFVGVPLSLRHGRWSSRLRLYHVSSHLGDEYLVRSPDVERINLSTETVDALLSYEWDHLRLYGGGGYIINSYTPLTRALLQYGAELRVPEVIGRADWVLAADIKHNEEQDWEANQSYRTGFTVSYGTRQVALMLAHYEGYSPDGQFYVEKMRYSGVEISVQL